MSIGLLEFALLCLAVYRICRFFIEDELFDSIRNRIWSKFPPESSKIGYFFTCYWCMGMWISIFVVVLYLLLPVPTLVGATILAISSVVGLIDRWQNT